MNNLYGKEYSLLLNFFLPSVKLQQKERIGSKIIKHHDKPATPCDRLLASRYIPNEKKQWLKQQRQSLNPFILQTLVHQKLKRILRLCSLRLQHPDLLSSERVTPNNHTNNTNVHRSRKEHQKPLQASHRDRNNIT